MNVRERVALGRSVRVPPLAEEVGLPDSTIYAWIKAGKLKAIRFENTLLIPASEARRLLDVPSEPAEPVAA